MKLKTFTAYDFPKNDDLLLHVVHRNSVLSAVVIALVHKVYVLRSRVTECNRTCCPKIATAAGRSSTDVEVYGRTVFRIRVMASFISILYF